MKLPVTKSADNVSHKITSGTHTAEFKSSEKAWYWNITKLQGGSEISASVKVNNKNNNNNDNNNNNNNNNTPHKIQFSPTW